MVDFDYDAADAALGLLERRVPDELGGQIEPRRSLGEDAATEWDGFFRTEFDRAEDSLMYRFGTVPEIQPGDIRAAAGRANDRQREYNQARQAAITAEEEREREQAEADGAPVPN